MMYRDMTKFNLRTGMLFVVLATLVVCQSAQAATIYQDMVQGMDGLLAYYTFDDVTTSSITLTDDSGNGHTGTFYSPGSKMFDVSTDTAGPGSESALNFLGDDGAFVKGIGETGFVTGNAARTVVLWMKSSEIAKDINGLDKYGYMVKFGNFGASHMYEMVGIVTYKGKVQCSQYGTGDDSATTVVDGAWHMIAVTVEPTTTDRALWTTYIDGSATADSSMEMITKTTIGSNGAFGSRDHGFETRTYNGLLDEVSYFDRALTVEEMGALYSGMMTEVPEPSTCILLITGLFGLLAYARRKQR